MLSPAADRFWRYNPSMADDRAPVALAIDIGGTFTDLAAVDRRTGVLILGKADTTPARSGTGEDSAFWDLVDDADTVGLAAETGVGEPELAAVLPALADWRQRSRRWRSSGSRSFASCSRACWPIWS